MTAYISLKAFSDWMSRTIACFWPSSSMLSDQRGRILSFSWKVSRDRAKASSARSLRGIIDPNDALRMRLPDKPQDLMIQAK